MPLPSVAHVVCSFVGEACIAINVSDVSIECVVSRQPTPSLSTHAGE